MLSACCLLSVPRDRLDSLRNRLSYIGYNVKKFMRLMSNNFCDVWGMDGLSEGERGRGPSRSNGRCLCYRGLFKDGTEKAHGKPLSVATRSKRFDRCQVPRKGNTVSSRR